MIAVYKAIRKFTQLNKIEQSRIAKESRNLVLRNSSHSNREKYKYVFGKTITLLVSVSTVPGKSIGDYIYWRNFIVFLNMSSLATFPDIRITWGIW